MTDDVTVGADGLDLGFVHSGDEEALVLVHLTPLPLENMAACPDPLVHSQQKLRLLVELTLGGALERLASLRPTAWRDPPPMSTLSGLQKQNSRSSVEQEDSCGRTRSDWNP